MIRTHCLGAALVLLAAGLPAAAQHDPAARRGSDRGIVIGDAWVRESTATRTSSSGYLRIVNRTDRPVALVQVSVVGAAGAQLHAIVDQEGRTEMRPLSRLTIPANASVDLAPGGTHIMLTDIARPLAVGRMVEMRLTFDDGGTRTVRAVVRPLSAMSVR
ncbi:MAG TPA: copper chaperone PCu(A)C [Vicinamibacterales bacterium]|jgi:copper(I)-binding protein|nr:copper chaperone PCu(A)C [Vicinamibacterales bacterium]